jgi:hypothetical protein
LTSLSLKKKKKKKNKRISELHLTSLPTHLQINQLQQIILGKHPEKKRAKKKKRMKQEDGIGGNGMATTSTNTHLFCRTKIFHFFLHLQRFPPSKEKNRNSDADERRVQLHGGFNARQLSNHSRKRSSKQKTNIANKSKKRNRLYENQTTLDSQKNKTNYLSSLMRFHHIANHSDGNTINKNTNKKSTIQKTRNLDNTVEPRAIGINATNKVSKESAIERNT